LTLTTTRAIMVRAGHQTYAIPTANVQQILRIDPKKQIASVGGRHVVTLGGPPLAISKLTNILEVDDRPDEPGSAGMLAVVVTSGQQQAVIVVDELLAEQDVTIKPLGSRIRRVRHISGATLYVPEATPLEPDEARREAKDPLREPEASSPDLAETPVRPEKRLRESGRIALVLNMANVVRSLLSLKNQGRLSTVKKHRLLVVDDSVTYRVFLQGILDAAGFDVETASDGQNALNKLRESRFDLVVSDVDMPALDGFQLAQEIRKSRNKEFAMTPIVLVTARGTDEDKSRGAASGADAYIVKSGFDQSTLLETIRQLL
ncbi:MAG: response regulator, partial [Planctomycetota bacterium]